MRKTGSIRFNRTQNISLFSRCSAFNIQWDCWTFFNCSWRDGRENTSQEVWRLVSVLGGWENQDPVKPDRSGLIRFLMCVLPFQCLASTRNLPQETWRRRRRKRRRRRRKLRRRKPRRTPRLVKTEWNSSHV